LSRSLIRKKYHFATDQPAPIIKYPKTARTNLIGLFDIKDMIFPELCLFPRIKMAKVIIIIREAPIPESFSMAMISIIRAIEIKIQNQNDPNNKNAMINLHYKM
jgi:hypothetical protein